jgi:tetratricopeptide (TPR) repeat protein
MQSQSAPSPSCAGLPWKFALILGLVFASYWPALSGGTLWDDEGHITRADLQSLAGLGQIWSNVHATQQYYPLLHSIFWVEHRLWGDGTLGYHLANMLLHATAACLLVLILRQLNVAGAWLAGLIFAVHPVCVESVAWISEQKNTLSLVFYLLSALAYLQFDRDRRKLDYVLAFLLFVFALLTKTVTATLPAALLVVFWWQRGRLSWRRDALPLVPWFILAAASGLLTSWVERTFIGARGVTFDLTLVQRVLLASRVVWFYLGKLVLPTHLVFIYPRWDAKASAAGWTGYLAAAVLVTAALWALRGRSRGPLAAWLFFVGSLFPALGFFNVYPFLYSYVADHFQYLASLGIITAAAAGAARLLARASPAVRGVGWGLAAILVAALGALSNLQSRAYADEFTLYTTTIERNPACWMAHNNLGLWYEGRGDAANAIAHFQEAIRLKDDFAAAHNNLGSVLGKMPGRLDEAVAHFQEALRLQPDFADALNNLGMAFLKTPGRLDDAAACFQKALRIRPGFAEAHNNLGNALSKMPGELDAAIAEYQQALRLKPGYAGAHNNLGTALYAQGRAAEAVAQYQEALRLMPAYAEIRYNIAMALLSIPGRANEAAEQLEIFLKARPDNEPARRMLAQIRASQP